MDGVTLLKWLEAAIPPLAFLLLLWALLEPKTSRRTAALAAAVFLAAEAVVQTAVFLTDRSPERVFTLFPLTLYLPAIVCLHLLSKNSFLPTALVWLLALLCEHLLQALQKLLAFLSAGWGGPALNLIPAVLPLLAAALLLTLVFRFLRTPFLDCAKAVDGGWSSLLFLPVMLLALSSYFLAGTTDAAVLILLFLTALAAFLVLSRLLFSLAETRRAGAFRRQMEALRRDYQLLQRKLELGRGYRHDIRHHMTALSALLQQGDCDGARRYVAGWQGQLTRIETETWCRNPAVNGVLSAYLAQARDAGCTLDAAVSLPESFPFEETDLCIVIANALENAVHACEAAPEGAARYIRLELSLAGGRRLTFRVENPCYTPLEFGSDGFPAVPRREGHGQGLRSIAAVAEKYHGLFHCACEEQRFILRVALLHETQPPTKRNRAPAVCAGAFLCLFLLNCLPPVADALETVPVLGPLVRVADLRSYSLHWGAAGVTVQDPALDGNASDEMSARKDAFLAQMREQFVDYATRKYQGYVAGDITYDVVRDDEKLFILRFRAALNAGGSVDCSRYLTLDKQTGQVLELSGLFLPEANYLFPISREIKAQMAEQNNAGEAEYFLPGGIWADEECFQSIDPDQNFYIDENGQLVIVFAEYEVAPGSMGEPEFVIPTDVLDGLLVQPSVLR